MKKKLGTPANGSGRFNWAAKTAIVQGARCMLFWQKKEVS
jgi:hypothetical protein